MANERQVEYLNHENPVFYDTQFGTLLQSIITLANLMANTVISLLTAGVAIATTASKVKTANAITYLCNGVRCTKGVTDNLWTPTGADLADGYTRKYLLLLDAAGNATVLASDDRLTAAAARCVFPPIPSGKVAVGLLQVDTSGAAYVPGTTLLSAGTVTDTYTDLVQPPAGVTLLGPLTPLV